MNNTYIICYDLKYPGGDYPGMENAIRALPLSVCYPMGHAEDPQKYQRTTWIVETNQTSRAIFDQLQSVLRSQDKLLVAEIGFGWTSHEPEGELNLPAWWARYPYWR